MQHYAEFNRYYFFLLFAFYHRTPNSPCYISPNIPCDSWRKKRNLSKVLFSWRKSVNIVSLRNMSLWYKVQSPCCSSPFLEFSHSSCHTTPVLLEQSSLPSFSLLTPSQAHIKCPSCTKSSPTLRHNEFFSLPNSSCTLNVDHVTLLSLLVCMYDP